MSVRIVTDSCHYLPAELAREQGIHQVSLYVHWPEGAQRESDISDYDAYYRRLYTSAVNPALGHSCQTSTSRAEYEC